ncbi:hypothetical protein FNV43_RR17086 [Rhamnella rubrinervis]|uniref:Uncharacterized protein n=1 Tax=Rhamnella rubrinervis TaxID=2594499 RepID=A0A8K0ME74_9ROSA|nr:hypothetical protein FNV43_RR17086 [Rhamnella rubrinervis]
MRLSVEAARFAIDLVGFLTGVWDPVEACSRGWSEDVAGNITTKSLWLRKNFFGPNIVPGGLRGEISEERRYSRLDGIIRTRGVDENSNLADALDARRTYVNLAVFLMPVPLRLFEWYIGLDKSAFILGEPLYYLCFVDAAAHEGGYLTISRADLDRRVHSGLVYGLTSVWGCPLLSYSELREIYRPEHLGDVLIRRVSPLAPKSGFVVRVEADSSSLLELALCLVPFGIVLGLPWDQLVTSDFGGLCSQMLFGCDTFPLVTRSREFVVAVFRLGSLIPPVWSPAGTVEGKQRFRLGSSLLEWTPLMSQFALSSVWSSPAVYKSRRVKHIVIFPFSSCFSTSSRGNIVDLQDCRFFNLERRVLFALLNAL